MERLDLLSGIQVLDLTQRLPGPLATSILFDLGAKVAKIEPPHKEDAFILFAKEDPLFQFWYNSLNKKKQIIKTNHSFNELEQLLQGSDIVVVGSGQKVLVEIIESYRGPLALIEVCGSSQNISMHDLNALALTSSFKLYTHNHTEEVLSPPHLPIAGIAFGQQIATTALAAFYKAKEKQQLVHQKVYIDDTAKQIYDHFWSDQLEAETGSQFLHNGKYPCYTLYRSLDGHYIALAAVEDKFWLKFAEISNLPLQIEQRFDTSERTFNLLKNYFNQLTLSEIKELFQGQDICLTTIN